MSTTWRSFHCRSDAPSRATLSRVHSTAVHPFDENKAVLSDVLPHVEALLALHREAMQTLSRAFGPQMNRPDECVLLLGVHAYNLTETLFRLIIAGRFDVAAYLLRPAWDIGGLILGAGSDESLAERFWNDTLRASDARREIAAAVRASAGDALADEMEKGWSADYGPLQELAHVKMIHLDKAVAPGTTGNIVPMLGGRSDGGQAIVMARGAIKAGVQSLVHLYAVRGKVLGEPFYDRVVLVHEHLLAWVNANRPVGERAG